MRFHVISLPHTHVTEAFSACAFTEKVRKFCIMMKDRGHEVFLYAGEQNEAPCDEHIVCISEAERAAHVGDRHYTQAQWDPGSPGWSTFNRNAIVEIAERIQPHDFICLIGGIAHKPIADAFPSHLSVEFGIGYGGTFANYKVYESYAWLHTCIGAATGGNPNAAQANWFDAVIPGYLEPEKFPFRAEKDDYYLFIGRLNEDKGFRIAADVCRQLGKRLLIAGPGTPPDYGDYFGVVGPEERGRLMAGAIACFVPSYYVEPFGNVAIEAMACGTPVLTTDWGAFTETVIDGVTGFRCRTYGEFLRAAENAFTLSPRAIRDHAIGNYALKVIGAKYERYFERLSLLWGEGWNEGRLDVASPTV